MSTKNNPGKYDCYAKAMPDEPFMTLLARDPSAPRKTREWAVERLESIVAGNRPKEDIEQVVEAMECADAMETWRIENNGAWRNPDLFINATEKMPTEDEHLAAVTGQLWQEILEKDDRTSPAEYPDMALISFDEFRNAIMTVFNMATHPLYAMECKLTDEQIAAINVERDFEDAQTRMRPDGSRFGKIGDPLSDRK